LPLVGVAALLLGRGLVGELVDDAGRVTVLRAPGRRAWCYGRPRRGRRPRGRSPEGAGGPQAAAGPAAARSAALEDVKQLVTNVRLCHGFASSVGKRETQRCELVRISATVNHAASAIS
jgi:hypothetical protein